MNATASTAPLNTAKIKADRKAVQKIALSRADQQNPPAEPIIARLPSTVLLGQKFWSGISFAKWRPINAAAASPKPRAVMPMTICSYVLTE